MPEPPFIVVAGVCKSFGRFTAVEDVSITVGAGEIVGLLGANGAGKTTLIRMITGLVAPDRGEVRIFGRAPERAVRSQIGYVPQGLGLYKELSVNENVDFVAAAYGVADRPPLPEPLAAARRRPIGTLGLGLQRQLAFYCALLARPRLLVLDEPTSGIDPLGRARLWETIHEQSEHGAGVLVTTHHLQEAAQCSRLAVLSHGRLVASGTLGEIIGGATAVAVDAPAWSDAFAALTAAGLAVTLAGRSVRVAGSNAERVQAALAGAGVAAAIKAVPATLEERMALIERHGILGE